MDDANMVYQQGLPAAENLDEEQADNEALLNEFSLYNKQGYTPLVGCHPVYYNSTILVVANFTLLVIKFLYWYLNKIVLSAINTESLYR